MSLWLQTWDHGWRLVTRLPLLEQALVREWGAASRLRLAVSGHDRAAVELALLAAEQPLWVSVSLDDDEPGERWPLSPQVRDEGPRLWLEACVTWAGTRAFPGTAPPDQRRRRVLSLHPIDTLLDHFQGLVSWESLVVPALQRTWQRILPQCCWVQDLETDEETLRRLLARVPELPDTASGTATGTATQSGSGAGDNGDSTAALVLSGGGWGQQGRWTVGWAAAESYREAGDVLPRTLAAPWPELPAYLGPGPGEEPSARCAGRRWRRGAFSPETWRAAVRAAPPFFVAGRAMARTIDRLQVADHAGELQWTTELWAHRAGDRVGADPPPPRPFFGCGTVVGKLDPQWLLVQLAGFEPSFDRAPVKLTTPYTGLDTPAVPGQVLPPEIGTRVGVVGSGRLGEPLYLLFGDRQAALPEHLNGLWSPRQLQLAGEFVALQAERDLSLRAGGTSVWQSRGEVRVQGENASLRLAGQRVTTG